MAVAVAMAMAMDVTLCRPRSLVTERGERMDLNGRNVVVTGASQGIGRRIAEEFAARGAKVLVAARSTDQLISVAAHIGGAFLTVDLTDPEQVDAFVPACLDELGQIDIFVNNAGLDTEEAFVNVDRDTIRAVARLNFEATLLLTRDVARHMLRRGSGHIVQMSSVSGAVPFPGMAAYAGTKAGITHFSETLRLELAHTGVNLTVVAPGPTDTAMWDRIESERGRFARPALRRFRRLQMLPTLSVDQVAIATVNAVERNRRFVRLPRRYGAYHALENAPRRLIEIASIGVRLERQVSAPDRYDTATIPHRAGHHPIWVIDNPPSTTWPLYTRGNVGEVFPEVVLPLTWSLFGPEAEAGWRAAFDRMGLVAQGDLPAQQGRSGEQSQEMTILGVFGGYCYINASYVRLLGVRAPGASVEAIDRQFFGESDAPAYRSRPGDKNRAATVRLGRTILRLLNTTSLPALEQDKRRVEQWLAEHPGPEATEEALIGHLVGFAPLFRHLFSVHIENTFSVALTSSALADLCAKADRPELLVSLLGGIGDIESAAPSHAMWKLSRLDPKTPEFTAAFESFLDEFGSRGPNEWDLAAEPWGLRPSGALAAIDRMRGADVAHDPVVQHERLSAERATAIAEMRGALNRVDRWQFDKALTATTLFSQARERSKTTVIRALHSVRLAHRELARRIAEQGGPDAFGTCLLTIKEFRKLLAEPTSAHLHEVVAEREALHTQLMGLVPPFVIDGQVPPTNTWEHRSDAGTAVVVGDRFRGIPGCPGVARGRARVVLDPAEPGELGPGDVLVAPITDPSWTPLFLAADAVVVDVGATMSHAVIVSRELGIPCVVSAVGATRSIPDGALIEVDGNAGTVTILAMPEDG
jgi:short-subunit dehydrogenase/phosphohistidine swiveling domain-containing protein